MDVLQAEAVQALIDAESEGQVREFAEGLGGESACSVALAGLRDALVGLRASWEARVDFPEDVSASPRAAEMADLDDVIDGFVDAAESGKRLRYLREGLRVALVGPVNSGKSSLFNAILKRERALVTPHPGTTRDTLEESIQVAGFPLVLIDTAGIRETVEPVERLGVERSLEAARRADGTILVYDGTKGWGRDEEAVLAALPERPLAILANKADLPGHGAGKSGTVSSSVVTGQGLASVVEALGAWVEERVPRGSVVMASERQADCVRRALEGCLRAREALKAGFTEEVALQGIKNAQDAMDELFGGGSPEELYDRIFSSFCIGK
jgi:tRNA modification GTPase